MAFARVQGENGEVKLAYIDQGTGPAVLLVHGFASTKEVNWLNTNWIRRLQEAGHRTIAFDNRGHGQSTKFYDRRDYTLEAMVADALALITQLDIPQADVIGYSMGARIAALLAARHGSRVRRLVLSGNGWRMVEDDSDWSVVEEALLAPSLDDVTSPRGRAFRAFADQTKSDRQALAACVAGVRQLVPESEIRGIGNAALVAVGSEDEVAGSGEQLANAMPNARYLEIPGRDHMRAVGDRRHIGAVIEFLQGGDAEPASGA
jgi:pimeloyl-ACP methyl ester carboxylesterase